MKNVVYPLRLRVTVLYVLFVKVCVK